MLPPLISRLEQPARYRIAFAVLMASVALVFWRHLFTTDVLFMRDVTALHYPHSMDLRRLVRAGLPPLWNPFQHFGEPVANNPDYLLFYPTAWLAWFLPPAYGFKLHYALHFFLLAAGSFFLARRIRLSPLACFAAGALFAFSGPVMSLGNLFNHLPAAAWMPVGVLAADYQARRGGWRGAAALAACLAMQLFAGGPESSLATGGLALGWVLAFHGEGRLRPGAPRNRLLLARFASSVALAAGLAAIQLAPALWHVRLTQRAAHLTFDAAFFWSLHPVRFLDILLPQFWGDPLSLANVPWVLLEGREPFLMSLFMGIVPLSLAFAGAVARRDLPSRYWAAVVIIMVVLALGRFTAASYLLYYVIPIFRVIRYPVKFLVPAALAVAQLAGMGVDVLMAQARDPAGNPAPVTAPPGGDEPESDEPAATAGAAERAVAWLRTLLAVFGLAWVALAAFTYLAPATARGLATSVAAYFFTYEKALSLRHWMPLGHAGLVRHASVWLLRAIPAVSHYVLGSSLLMILAPARSLRAPLRRRLVVLAVVAAVSQLGSLHHRLNPLADRRYLDTTPPVMALLKAERPPLRIFAELPVDMPDLPPSHTQVSLTEVDFLPETAWEFYSYRLGLQTAATLQGVETGFTEDAERMLIEPQAFLTRAVTEYKVRRERLVHLLRLGSMEYALYRRMPPSEGLEWVGTAPNTTTTPVQVYRVIDPAPRAYLAPEGRLLAAGMPTLLRLLSPDFDPTREVVLDRDMAAPLSGVAPLPGQFSGGARLLRREPLRVEAETSASAPAYLVLTDSYNPEWVAWVDGQRVPLLRANQIFRAVRVPAGRHRVVLVYRPVALFFGAAVSFLTLLVLLVNLRRAPR